MAYLITQDCKGCSYCVQWCPSGAITGRRKVRYSIDSSRCIECGACGRICVFSAVLTPTGSQPVRMRLSLWPKPKWNYEKCDRCGKCITACPAKCVQPAGRDEPDHEKLNGYPHLTRLKLCISCGFCERDCPRQAVTMVSADQRKSQ